MMQWQKCYVNQGNRLPMHFYANKMKRTICQRIIIREHVLPLTYMDDSSYLIALYSASYDGIYKYSLNVSPVSK